MVGGGSGGGRLEASARGSRGFLKGSERDFPLFSHYPI